MPIRLPLFRPAAVFAFGLVIAAQQASAGLLVADFLIRTDAVVQRNGESTRQTFERASIFPLLPVNLRSQAALPPNSVDARQSEGGVYSNRSVAAVPDFFTNDVVNVTGSTTYRLVVTSDIENTPLLLDFTFLGSEVFGGALYGDGDVRVRTTNLIGSAFVSPFAAGTTPSTTWGFIDEVTLRRGAGDRFSGSRIEVDLQGIGLPVPTETYGYREFESRGRIERETFAGTLDFGTLDPFELFVLEFTSQTSIDLAGVRYTGSARAGVVDPFALASPAGMRFELRGLALRTPADPEIAVPAPAMTGMLALGLFAGALHRVRTRAAALAA
jgi:hypothetical protein